MPTVVRAHPKIIVAVNKAGGKIIQIGTKPWAEFNGPDAAERAIPVEELFVHIHGYSPTFAGKPWREGQAFDYAIRLD